jgi:hypothetical protein
MSIDQVTANANEVVTKTGSVTAATLQVGSAVVGKVGIDQTTPGTTNGVQINAALPAGTNNIGDVDVLTLPALVAGTAVIGKVGIDQTTDGTTNKVQAHLNVAGAAQAVTNPAPVSSPAFVISASQTRPNNTTSYTALDVVGTDAATNISFDLVNRVPASGYFIILGVSLLSDANAVPSGMGNFRLHLFSEAPTAITDNLAFNLIAADRTKYIGSIDIPTPTDLGDTLFSRVDNLNFVAKLASSATAVIGVLQTLGAYTPSAQSVQTITLRGIQS